MDEHYYNLLEAIDMRLDREAIHSRPHEIGLRIEKLDEEIRHYHYLED